MGKKTSPLLPASEALLSRLGERLRLARLRRRLAAKQVAERAGMSPMTLRSLERGGSGVTIGAYLAAMQVLGIEQDLELVGQADTFGRELQDARLPAVNPRKPRPRIAAAPAPSAAPARRAAEKSPRKSRPRAPDWIDKGGFASSEALAELLAPTSKKRH